MPGTRVRQQRLIGSVNQHSEVSMAIRETGNLIGSDKVEGTAVYGADQQKIGSVDRVMIDKSREGLHMPF